MEGQFDVDVGDGIFVSKYCRLTNAGFDVFETAPEDGASPRMVPLRRVRLSKIKDPIPLEGNVMTLMAGATSIRLLAQNTNELTDWKKAIEMNMNRVAVKRRSVKQATDAGGAGSSGASEAEVSDPSSLLSALATLLSQEGLRLSQLFRNPKYNPSYTASNVEELDATQLAGVLARASIEAPVEVCEELISLVCNGTKRSIGIVELEAALRANRRGKDIWMDRKDGGAARPRQDWKRPGMTEEQRLGPKWAAPTLQVLSDLLDAKSLRVADLFRQPRYNPSYLHAGDESLDAKEIHAIFINAGLDLSYEDVKNMVDCIDADGSGSLEMNELEHAIRKFRRGTMQWVTPQAKKKQVLNLNHLNSMHERHEKKFLKISQHQERTKVFEAAELEKEIEDARLGTRKKLNKDEYNGDSARERLHQYFQEEQRRKVELVRKAVYDEQQQLEATRIRPARSHSAPGVRREIRERQGDFHEIGHRLHALHSVKDAGRRYIREEDEARLLVETNRLAQEVISRRGGVTGNRHHQLHKDATDRKSRRDKIRWLHLEEEARRHASRSIGRERNGLNPATDFERIRTMYDEGKKKLERNRELAAQQELKTQQVLQERAAKSQEGFRLNKFKAVASRWGEELDEAPPPKSPRTKHAVGFGSGTPRPFRPGQTSSWSIDAVDHTLTAVNNAVASRANCNPDIRQFKVLQDLIEPLQVCMTEFREAHEESLLHSEGAEYLRQTQSRRLFADGRLLEDTAGWHNVCEADKLRQIQDDFDVLLEQGARAQNMLLMAVGPGLDADTPRRGADPELILRRWPIGAKWNHPAATKKSQFAYNPGPKSRTAAEKKAFVRYGPAEGELRYRHLLDLARVCLVFVDATLLRAGLEQLIERFEVVNIRNFYHPTHESLLKQRHVEVTVVLKIPEPFLCEIRLEEYSFLVARQKVQPHIETIGRELGKIYLGNGAELGSMAYLASHILQRPKELHSLTVFKKHLARRYGSTVAAWRRVLGDGKQVTFNTFRRVCQQVGQRHRASEFWQSLDPTSAGCISLFELDPDAVVLLIKFYWRILGVCPSDIMNDPQKLFNRLTSKSVTRLTRQGHLMAHEFRRVTKAIGFSHHESDTVFEYLDSAGGSSQKPPATLVPSDLGWLRKLSDIVSIECVMLKDPTAADELDNLRQMTFTGSAASGRARTPSAMSRRSLIGAGSPIAARTSLLRRASQVSTPASAPVTPRVRPAPVVTADSETPAASPMPSQAASPPAAPATPPPPAPAASPMPPQAASPPAAPATPPPLAPADSPMPPQAASPPAAPAAPFPRVRSRSPLLSAGSASSSHKRSVSPRSRDTPLVLGSRKRDSPQASLLAVSAAMKLTRSGDSSASGSQSPRGGRNFLDVDTTDDDRTSHKQVIDLLSLSEMEDSAYDSDIF